MRPVELGREETRRGLEDLVRPAQLGNLTLESLQLRRLLRCGARPCTAVDLGLADPLPQRLHRPDPQLRSDRPHRRPLRLVLIATPGPGAPPAPEARPGTAPDDH